MTGLDDIKALLLDPQAEDLAKELATNFTDSPETVLGGLVLVTAFALSQLEPEVRLDVSASYIKTLLDLLEKDIEMENEGTKGVTGLFKDMEES